MADTWLSRIDFSPSESLHADDLNNIGSDIRTWKGDVNGGGHHLANVIIDNYFPGAGYPLLSPIHVIPTSTDYTAQVRLDSEAANNPARWVINKDASPETGANAGSNFQIVRCADDGSSIDTPIAINRASGIITLGAQQWAGNVNGGGYTLSNVIIPSVFQDPTQAKGDLVASMGSGLVRFPLGGTPDGMVLITDSTTQFGIKWGQSPAVPLTRKINTATGSGLSGGGALTSDLNLSAAVVSVFGRTGAVVLMGSDVSGVGGVMNTFTINAGAGMSGGGPMTGSSITLNALVTSVMGQTGDVKLAAADISAAGGVPASRLVKAGAGMSGGGNLSTDITLNALVTSVFGNTGDVVLTGPIIQAAGGVLQTQHIATPVGSGLTGGGQIGTGDLTLSVLPDTTVQKTYFGVQGSIQPTPRSTINFVPGPNKNINVVCTDDPTLNAMDVAIDATGTIGIWLNGTLQSNQYNAINFIEGTGIVITPTANSSANFGAGWVDVTISATGGGSGGGGSVSQSPWTTPIDAAGNYLGNVSFIGVDRTADFASPPTAANARVAIQANGPEIGLRAAQAMSSQIAIIEADNDNGTAKVALKAYGSQFNTPPGTSLKATSGLDALAGPMTFAINGSEAARISTGKRVLIGTSLDDGNNLLQVNGNVKILPAGSGIIFPDGTLQTTAGGGALQDPTTSKGDLIVHNAAVGTTRLPVGTTNGMVLTADSTVSNGVSWQTSPGQSPWITNIDGNGKQLQNAGGIGIGTYTIPITNAVAGRSYLTVTGSTAAGIIELATGAADADATLLGELAWTSPSSTNTDKRSATIDAYRSGTTANNRGSFMAFSTKVDGGALTERMRINNVGNVGIGTASPAALLHVSGATSGFAPRSYTSIFFENGSTTYLELAANASPGPPNVGIVWSSGAAQTSYMIDYNGAVQWVASGASRPIQIFTNSIERLRITPAGNVGIGTTNPGAPLHVATTSGDAYVNVQGGSGAHVWALMSTASSSGWAPAGSFALVDGTAGSTRFVVSPTGYVGINNNAPANYLVVAGPPGTCGWPVAGSTTASVVFIGGSDSPAWGLFFGAYANGSSWLQCQRNDANTTVYPLILNPLGGNVGIGVTTPRSCLSLITANIGSPNNAQLTIGESGNNPNYGLRVGYSVQNGAWVGILDTIANGTGSYLYINQTGGPVSIGAGYNSAQVLSVFGGTYGPPAGSGSGPDGEIRIAAVGHGEVLDIGIGGGTWIQSRNSGDYSTKYPLYLQPTGGVLYVGAGNSGGIDGDIVTARVSNASTGCVYFSNSSGAVYLFYDGSQFNFSRSLFIGGNCNINGQFQVNGVPIQTGQWQFAAVQNVNHGLSAPYQNPYGKPMFVTVSYALGGACTLAALMSSTNSNYFQVALVGSVASSATPQAIYSMHFCVPSGWWYYIQVGAGAGASYTFQSWTEWY